MACKGPNLDDNEEFSVNHLSSLFKEIDGKLESGWVKATDNGRNQTAGMKRAKIKRK